ncbi:MAG: 50S ribosomal protein L13 [Candidatus Caldarchaeum sp.]|nr:50S ribosomal protein L13 [Candidatus Caldarchaeum sp.]
MAEKNYVVNAEGYRMGRLASYVAKLLLKGHRVTVYNAEKAVITGKKSAILEHYNMLRGRRQFTSHKKITVWYPTRPDAILRLAIVRMLPRKKASGREAMRRLKVVKGAAAVSGEPIEFEDAKLVNPVSRSAKVIRYLTLEELSLLLRGGRK